MSISRRTFIRRLTVTTLAGVAGASVFAYAEDTLNLEQKIVRLSIGLSSPLRVVALGDIHFDPMYNESYLQKVVNHVSALQPDLVILTGDFVTANALRMDDLARLLSQAKARLGVVAILGNHDMWTDEAGISRALKMNDIRVLRNACYELPGEKNFFITGLESYWGGSPDPSVISRTPADSRHILLVHEPDPFAKFHDPRIKLQISGHTHGGQVRVPFVGALILPEWGEKFQAGLYTRNGSFLYVNRGIGTLRPHIRLNCRPELTVFELT